MNQSFFFQSGQCIEYSKGELVVDVILGTGGFATVYSVIDKKSDKKFALKVSHVTRGAAKEEMWKSMVDEANLDTKACRYIANALESWIDEFGRLYYLMPICGISCSQLLADCQKAMEAIPLSRILEILFCVTKALEFLFVKGLLHG